LLYRSSSNNEVQEIMAVVKVPKLAQSSQAEQEDQLVRIAKALAHPARLQIIAALMRSKTCIGCDLAEETGLAASTTSEHLRILKAAGVITGEIERPRVCYSLNPSALAPLQSFLNSITSPAKPSARSRKSR
jgi:ArsR family transcriptional regulator, arsenate/arsenite/antimonite-responsive transcriptional repressor